MTCVQLATVAITRKGREEFQHVLFICRFPRNICRIRKPKNYSHIGLCFLIRKRTQLASTTITEEIKKYPIEELVEERQVWMKYILLDITS